MPDEALEPGGNEQRDYRRHHADVGGTRRTDAAHQRQPTGEGDDRAEQGQPAKSAPGGDDQCSEKEPVADADLRRNRTELVGDRQPSRAPDEDASAEY
jgi:hypothetical protein